MEKQQEILFSIVSESRQNQQRQAYQPRMVPVTQMGYQIDPFLRMAQDRAQVDFSASAFKPSKTSSASDTQATRVITPVAHQPQSATARLSVNSQGSSTASHNQLLTDICSTIISKPL